MKNKQQKSGGGFTTFIAAVCIIVYLFALVQAVVRLYFSFEQNQAIAQEEFMKIKVLAIAAGSQGFMDDRFVQTINNALLSTKVLEALIITGPDDEYAFEKQKGRAIAWSNRSPRFIKRISFSGVPYYDPLPINNLRNTNIKAVANAFDYDEISNILRDTLLLILIGFSISFFTMLMQLLLGGKSREFKNKNFMYVNTQPVNQQPMYPAQPMPQPMPAAQASSAAQSAVPSFTFETENYSGANISVPSGANPAESGPKGLYSSRSNIGWEEYTKDRLDAEVHRCASMEKDLTFMMMELSNNINDAAFKAIAEDASNILSNKDMLFEFGNNGIYAILPGIDLNSAIVKSEKFYQKVMQNHPDCDLNIGITSRSGRLLNADRLILESKEALNKAKYDASTSIIAFKSDPEKYRNYISQQG